MTAFPERPPGHEEPPPPPRPPRRTPSPPHHFPRDPRDPRFPSHGDLLSDSKFPYLYGFSVPPKPPIKSPRYMSAWLSHLLTGPFLPAELRTTPIEDSNADSEQPKGPENLLLFLENAWGHQHDLITELVATGKWQHAVWIVRTLLEPTFEYPADTATQSIFEGTKYTFLSGKRGSPNCQPEEPGIPSPAIAGRSGLWQVKDPAVKFDIERRRRGFAIVLGSVAGMVIRAGERLPDGKDRLGDQYTDLLPTARQILAYCHTASLIPDQLYTIDRYPRLYIMRSRIMASLADAVWKAREAMVAAEAASLGIIGEHLGMEVPRAHYTLSVWGSGTKDISDLQADGEAQIPYAEREIWLELILTIIVEAGYGNIGVSIIKDMTSLIPHRVPQTWSFIDYSEHYSTEYTPANIHKLNHEPKTGIAERWALGGHSLTPPPLTTHPFTLPDWILPAVADAIVDSTAEGRGLESMFRSILLYAKTLPMRRETMLRLLRHPALVWSKNAEVMEVGAGLLWQFGDRKKAIDMYYASLALYISADNITGAMRVWKVGVVGTRSMRRISTETVAKYLWILVRQRQLGYAWSLLRHRDGPPIIDRFSPVIVPALLALAIQSKTAKARVLYEEVVAAVARARTEGMVTAGMYCSIMNAHLEFGDLTAAKETLLQMREDGVAPDGVTVGVLIRHELTRDREAGYRLVEESRGITISQEAWIAVLDCAVDAGDTRRTTWALEKLGVNKETGLGFNTIIFNILLRGVSKREGCKKAMEMCHRHHTRGDQGDGRVVGDAKSFRTVLHCAVRELIGMNRVEDVERAVRAVRGIMEGRQIKGKGKEKERREVEGVIRWCWEEFRGSGMEIMDVVGTVRQLLWKRMEEGENVKRAVKLEKEKMREEEKRREMKRRGNGKRVMRRGKISRP